MCLGMTENVGFIGLGVMGAGMAHNLLKAGFAVTVTTSVPEKADIFRDRGATVVATPREVAVAASIVVTCVPDHAALEVVVSGEDGMLSSDGWTDGLLIDCSTIAPDEARAIGASIAVGGGAFVDAPISGGRKGADEATLSIMCGGSEADFQRALPVFEAMGRSVRRVGDIGAGQTLKACNQTMVLANLMGVSEAIGMARAGGVDPKVMRELILTSTGRSGVLENNAKRYMDGQTEPGFRIALMRKDIGIAESIGAEAGLVQPATALAHQLLRAAKGADLDDQDTSALMVLYDRLNGTPMA
ncbi:NAD(P)-dependent oxidoreductase [Primorskyibacter flagellatus]|uniref:NAD(P)-dependent oxidoreductase n=1 Tax=Primorskyibacter flagellatus TaxID=1387277 RepID=UPI003A8DD175